MTTLLLYSMLTAASYYLLARAEITRFLWSRYSPRLDRFMGCAACTGFWYGLAASSLGWMWQWDFMGLPPRSPYTPIIVAFCSMIWTPVVAWLHLFALDQLVIPDQEDSTAGRNDADKTKS